MLLSNSFKTCKVLYLICRLLQVIWMIQVKREKNASYYWMGNGEVAANIEVDCSNLQAMVHNMSLGPDYWRVCLKKILVSKISLFRAASEFMILENAKDSSITLATKYII
ncbi:hypothetical protein ACOSP7_016153 [Xanthoceras sorbifolium]